jgi:lipopolysaccharide transport system ATP-binding protein
VRASAIRVEGLGKEYVIGGRAMANENLRDLLASSVAAPFRRFRKLRGDVEPEERFWALKDVSFEVGEGEVVGIIGRNGAGKSTLLKILSRITAPTKGRVEIRGRVASLLEVGTGFNPELTGRENIYLNGTILGMSRAEINRKFDEIVDFAGVDKFLDTPVKRYSSGMAVRLAFAVAAHLEPEILLVDEVLAVGDAEFQKKSLGRMRETSKSGRTVFLVSHNMSAIRSLCDKGILLDAGRLLRFDATEAVLTNYLGSDQLIGVFERRLSRSRISPTIVRAAILDKQYNRDAPALCLALDIWADKKTDVAIDVRLKDQFGTPLAYGTLGSLTPERPVKLAAGTNKVHLRVRLSGLALGSYLVSLDLNDPNIRYIDRIEDCLRFQLDALMFDGVALPQAWGYGSSLICVEQINLELADQHASLTGDEQAIQVGP